MTADLSVDLSAGTVSSTETGSDTIANTENIDAGAGNDTITGDDQSNTLWRKNG